MSFDYHPGLFFLIYIKKCVLKHVFILLLSTTYLFWLYFCVVKHKK
ncbi:hypothetical protein M120_5001 [Bacteroides fragilis str. 3783N1-8]|nr:hypothetical protein M120_5001 [Bacteroides fragilis str. 3783N1-8]